MKLATGMLSSVELDVAMIFDLINSSKPNDSVINCLYTLRLVVITRRIKNQKFDMISCHFPLALGSIWL